MVEIEGLLDFVFKLNGACKAEYYFYTKFLCFPPKHVKFSVVNSLIGENFHDYARDCYNYHTIEATNRRMSGVVKEYVVFRKLAQN